jgi:type II secretory pathway pseudopilin PulG
MKRGKLGLTARRVLRRQPADCRGGNWEDTERVDSRRGDGGFSIVEVIAAVLILMVVLVSLSNLLIDSLSTALVSKEREAAASLASDVIENARALGVTALTSGTTATCSTGSAASPLTTPAIETAGCFQAGYTAWIKVNTTTYAEQVADVSTTTTQPVTVNVTVSWTQGSNNDTYTSSGVVGV